MVILKYGGEKAKIFFIAVFPDVHPVQQNLSLLWIIQTAQKLNKRGFPGAIAAHHGNLFPLAEFAADIPQAGDLPRRGR